MTLRIVQNRTAIFDVPPRVTAAWKRFWRTLSRRWWPGGHDVTLLGAGEPGTLPDSCCSGSTRFPTASANLSGG